MIINVKTITSSHIFDCSEHDTIADLKSKISHTIHLYDITLCHNGKILRDFELVTSLNLDPDDYIAIVLIGYTRKLDIPENWNCLICTERQTTIVFNPCGHFAICEKCCKFITRCPICRSHIDKYMYTERAQSYQIFDKCANCKTNSINTIFMPCLHHLFCKKCAMDLKKCWICD